jgi:SAM-dependent methyltransferase
MSDALSRFYAEKSEATRLLAGIGPLEAARTRELLLQFLPSPPATIYDVGGGTGPYAQWLAQAGYSTHLLDLVADHIAAARDQHPRIESTHVGDARTLPWADESADVVLLMGPLYHLTAASDRIMTLAEARRVLRPGGLLFATVIPRWASALVGLLRGWVFDPAYGEMVRAEVTSGTHTRPVEWPGLFMDGYFHGPADVEREIATSGLVLEQVLAIEGPSWLVQDFDAAWQDGARRERMMEVARLAEAESSILSVSPHVAVVARKDANPVA